MGPLEGSLMQSHTQPTYSAVLEHLKFLEQLTHLTSSYLQSGSVKDKQAKVALMGVQKNYLMFAIHGGYTQLSA